jgi:hypothetical protein
MLLGNFDVKVGKEDLLKPTIGNKSLHEISNDNGVRIVKFVTLKTCIRYGRKDGSTIDSTSAIRRLQESLGFSEEGSIVQYSHAVYGTHEKIQAD